MNWPSRNRTPWHWLPWIVATMGRTKNDELSPSLPLGFFPASDMIPATTLEPPIGSLDRVVFVVFESEHARSKNDQRYEVFIIFIQKVSAGVNISASARL